MNQLNKQEQAKEVYQLQKALVHFSDRANDKRYEDKTERERRISSLVNASLMELHKMVEEESLERGQITPAEQLADQLLSASNALRAGDTPIPQDVTDDFTGALKILDLANAAKNAGKTAVVADKLKNL